jgi:hypothetical protein
MEKIDIYKNNRKIIKLNKKLSDIFEYFTFQKIPFDIKHAYRIKYLFNFEYDYGFIEYKRTLSTYNNKKEKLLRQIYWRISESTEYSNLDIPFCYYIIGLEDNGKASNQDIKELEISLQTILDSINNTNLKYKYVYLFNELNKSYLLVIKLWIEDDFDDFTYFV